MYLSSMLLKKGFSESEEISKESCRQEITLDSGLLQGPSVLLTPFSK